MPTSDRIVFPLVLLTLLTMPLSGQAQSTYSVHRSSPSELETGKLAAKPAKQDEGQSSDPVRANLDALNALKAGQPNRSLLALSSTQQVLFQEDFSHPDSMAQRWSWSINNGTLIYQNHCLELSAKGYHFPVIQTLNDPFPATGDWTVSIGYKYTGDTVCGTELKIARLDGSNLPDLACIHEDNNGQFLSIDEAGQVWRQSPNQDWHVLTLSKQGSRIKTIMDGKAVADTDSGASPVGFRFGNLASVGWDATWTSQQIQFVEVTAPRRAGGLAQSATHIPSSPIIGSLPQVVASLSIPSLPRAATTIELPQGEDNACCVLGDTLHFFGQSSGKHRLTRHAFEINGQPYTDLPVGPDEDGYSFTWKPNAPGTYHLAVKYTLKQPYDVVKVKEATLIILPKIPAALNQLAQSAPTDIPASVQPLDTSVFRPARVEFSLDGQPVGAAQAPFQVMLPISKVASGQHTLTYRMLDAQGLRYQGETQTITVPERINLALPSSLTITDEKEKTPLSIQLTPGLKVAQVNYFVGDKQVASSAQAPYNASADLAPFKSGAYDLKAQAVTSDFGTFSSPSLHIALTNRPDDDRLTRLAKEEDDRLTRLAKEKADRQKLEDVRLAKQASDAVAAKTEQDRLYAIAHPSVEVLDSNTESADKNGQIKITLAGDLMKYGGELGDNYSVILKISNLSSKTIHIFSPELVFDDFSIESLVPKEKYASDRIYVNVDPKSSRVALFIATVIIVPTDTTRKPLRIRVLGVNLSL